MREQFGIIGLGACGGNIANLFENAVNAMMGKNKEGCILPSIVDLTNISWKFADGITNFNAIVKNTVFVKILCSLLKINLKF